MKQLVIFIATGIYSGYIRPFPGTWGTIPAWLIAFFLIGDNPYVLIAVAAVTFFLSVWSAGRAEKFFGHDARKIVIDEWAGMFITLIFVPYSLINFAVAFVVFRIMDVVKFPPLRRLETCPRGWGVTLDDVGAGIYANLITQVVVWSLARRGINWG